MKWIGQHIYDQISRFRNDVYLEDIPASTETDMLVVDSAGKVSKRAIDAITVDVSDFLTDGADNRVVTATGADALLAETYLTFQNTGNVSTLSVLSDQDTGDLFSIATTTHGATTITTVDDDAAAAHFEIAADGNITLDAAGDIVLEAGGNDVTVDTDTFTIESAASNRPVLVVNSTSAESKPAQIYIDHHSASPANNDYVGVLGFRGNNDDGAGTLESISFAQINCAATSVATDAETGMLEFMVRVNNGVTSGGTPIGLSLIGTSSSHEIDVNIANGAASTTTVAGTLTMGSTATLNNTGQIQVASQPSITTLAGLTSLGAAGATTDIAAGDLTMYNAVNDGTPTISIGSSATERLEIKALYASGTQQVSQAVFTTYTASGTGNRGRFVFSVDETTALQIWDAGLNLSAGKALQINGTNIISDNGGGVATLSNIDALDATTEATIEAAMDTLPNVTSLGTLTGLTTSGAIELGHTSDTTIARGAPGVVTIEGNQVVTQQAVTAGSGQFGPFAMRVARRTLTTAEMNSLHTTPIEIIPAQGANLVIIPTHCTAFVDTASTNSGTGDLIFGYDSPASFQNSIFYSRRFHNNVATDMHYAIDGYTGKWGTSLTAGVNTVFDVHMSSAASTNCFTSVDIYVTYYVIDRS